MEVVVTKLWKCASAVVKLKTKSFKPTALFQTVNLRTRMDPPLPDTVFGSFVWAFVVIVEEESKIEIHKLVQKMRETKNDFLNKVNKFKGEGGYVVVMESLKGEGRDL